MLSPTGRIDVAGRNVSSGSDDATRQGAGTDACNYVREDRKLLPHVQCICFSDGVNEICLLSSIVDCDSKGSRRFSIQCFGSLLNETTVSVRRLDKVDPAEDILVSNVVDRFVLSDFRYSHITIHPRPSLDSHISPI